MFDESDLRETKKTVEWLVCVVLGILVGAVGHWALGCATAYPPEEPAFVEVVSTRVDAGQ